MELNLSKLEAKIQPEAVGTLRSTMIMGCAIAETTGIYSLLIAFLILFAL